MGTRDVTLVLLCVFGLISITNCKYVEGDIDSSSDWKFITRFCFLSAKGTLKFTFEYPVSYGPQNILLYYDTEDQWDAVYKSDKTCTEREAVLNVNRLQVLNLTTLYGLSGCVIKTVDNVDKYYCRGGRTFRSSRERWWYIAVSHCYKDLGDPCNQKLEPLDTKQVIEISTNDPTAGCQVINKTGTMMYRCDAARKFKSSRERWWFMAVSRCVQPSWLNCSTRVSILERNPKSHQIIYLSPLHSQSGCSVQNINGVDKYVCSGGRVFRSARERWWYIAVSRCNQDRNGTCAQRISVLNPQNNQIIYLSTSYSRSGCAVKNIDGVDNYVCSGGRTFRSARERWWYVAVSRCDQDLASTCFEKEDILNPQNNQKIILTPYSGTNSGCQQLNINGEDMYRCEEDRRIISARERWWYIAVSHCDNDPPGIKLHYEIHMTNGPVGDYLHREYSADEFYILPISCAFLGAYALLCVLTIICAVLLRNRQLWHTTYKMYMLSVFLWTFYLFLMSVAYGIYGNDGLEFKLRATKYAARSFESISIMVFLLMLILIAKGYTITRGRLSTASTIKITVFMTLYAVTYVVIFIWEAIVFDPGLVLYLYESPPGYALIAMRIIGYLWFCYAIFFTLKHYPEKGKFYYPLFVFYTLWFWAGPIVIIIAMTSMAEWSREKTVFGVESFVAFCGHVFFLVLTRPSAANKNFPYHVRTTQIGIMQNVPHQLEGAENTDSFTNHAYAVSSPLPSASSGPDLTGLFTTSKTRSDEKQRETSLNGTNGISNGVSNGMTNGMTTGVPPPSYRQTPSFASTRGRMNSTAHLMSNVDFDETEVDAIPTVPTPEEPSAPPPRYEELFRAQSQDSTQ